ncbi:YciC family protein [Candidatus Steffania adelgidicola]|uniref:YciC family protein n=1 Tax=Candidatus Steffania adelgidicola TaxID=1076626 RepID=UPI001D02809C|nr:YciC family protein [Candidatus Steffania adelgidicola]UDG79921.1 hypothetical protein GFK82_00467 [Candidatus Steffania adelgidicola]
MPIRVSTLSKDMLNFFRYQFSSIMFLVLLSALISVVLGHALSPGCGQLMMLNNADYINETTNMSLYQLVEEMSIDQQRILFKAAIAGTLSSLLGNVVLSGALLTIIRMVSNRQPVSVFNAISLSVPLLTRLTVLIFLTTVLVQLGLLLIIVPGFLLAIAFSLAPVIIATRDNAGAIKSMSISASLAFPNLRLLAPAVLLWLLAKVALLLLATQYVMISPLIIGVILNVLSNLISALLLIYLYRLYMLLPQN